MVRYILGILAVVCIAADVSACGGLFGRFRDRRQQNVYVGSPNVQVSNQPYQQMYSGPVQNTVQVYRPVQVVVPQSVPVVTQQQGWANYIC